MYKICVSGVLQVTCTCKKEPIAKYFPRRVAKLLFFFLLLLLFFRRDTKPVDSYSFSSPLFGSRKRVIIPESTKKTPDENLINKKSKVISDNDASETLHSQTQKDSVIQKRKNRDSGIEKTNVSMVISSIDFDQLLYSFDQRRLD